jgi:hypothetical protein
MKGKTSSNVRSEKRSSSEKRGKVPIYKARDAQEILAPLLKERRTSYERWRRLGRGMQQGDELPMPQRDAKQFGPKQMVYSPPEMRLVEKLQLRESTRLHPRLRQLIQGNTTTAVRTHVHKAMLKSSENPLAVVHLACVLVFIFVVAVM